MTTTLFTSKSGQQYDIGSLDIHWREDGWIGLDPSIVAHPYVEEAKEYSEEVMA